MGRSRCLGWVVLLAWVLVGGCHAGGGAGRVSGIQADPCAPSGGFGFTAWGDTAEAGLEMEIRRATFATPSSRIPVPRATMGFVSEFGTFGGLGGSPSAGYDDDAGAGLPGVRFVASRETNLVPSNYTPPEEPGEDRPAPTTWKRSAVVPNTSKLTVGDEEDLPLEALDVSVDVDGFRARVVLDLFYRNTKEQQLEGSFSVRLPDGASPYYVAFGQTKLEKPAFTGQVASTIAAIQEQRAESWETVKEARMVPREKAAYAYTETVRQKIDPALLEWSGAGVFSARVFPLVPGRLHRIVVGYDVDLLPVGEDLLYRLDLPEGVPDLEVDLSVAGGDAEVTPATAPQEGRYHWRRPEERTILARLRAPGAVLLQGEDAGTGPHFAAQFRPVLPEAPGHAKDRAVFLVDVSLSANPDPYNVWLALLETVLTQNRPDLKEFALGFFNVETFWWREGFSANTPANVAQALEFARTLSLEGATDLGQAFEDMSRLGGDYDVFLLGDGGVTWGENDLYALSRRLGTGHALFAYLTGLAGTDGPTLAHLARETGGAVFAVTGEDAVAAAATAHRKRPWRLRDVQVQGASDLLLAGRPTTLFPGQVLRLVGRGRVGDGAVVRLTVEQDGALTTVKTPLAQPLDSPLAARAYGQVAVGQIEGLGEARDVARAYATHFRVVGTTCSLLMLDSEADYERYGIKPDEDAFLVQKQPAADVVERTLREHGAALGDPKRRTLAWLERLERMDETRLALPDAVKLAIRGMPEASFRADAEALRCKARRQADLPEALRKELADRSFTYDGLLADADRRRRHLGTADGLRALSSLVEHHPGDLVLARDVAFTAMEWGLGGQACALLRRVVEKRPAELPTYHAIATALEGTGHNDLALVFFETALAAEPQGGKYGDFRLIVSFDYLRFLRQVERGERRTSVPDLVRARRKTLAEGPKVKEADLVLVMAWNTDRTDVDLHVTDPKDEECFYSHRDTKIGGHLTADVTQGFGPEMFVLRDAVPGEYAAEAHYYAGDATRLGARSKVYVTLYEDWGRKNERVTRKTVTLGGKGERQRIAVVTR